MAITNAGQLVTPEQFEMFYFEQLKTELESSDLSISKVGLVGLFLHILGNLQYDTKNYYDGLFKESFPITSTNDSNLAQHSILFNYSNKLAQAAQINGTLQFDFLNLPQKLNSVVKRELIFENIAFQVDSIPYKILSKNTITIDTVNNVDYYRIETINTANEQIIQPISPQYPEASLINCNQIELEELVYAIPIYPYDTYYQIEIELTDLFISDLIVTVKEYNTTNHISYNISQNKTFAISSDNIIFYSLFTRNGINTLLLELGSGKHGKYIPNSELKLSIFKTKGVLGNIGTQTISGGGFSGTIQLTDYNIAGDIVNSSSNLINPNTFLKINIIEATAGKDPYVGNTLRRNLVEFIQSRNNLLNELDFRNILSKYFRYNDFNFKKLAFQDNIIGLYVAFLNRLGQPEYTATANIPIVDFEIAKIDDIYIYEPELIIAEEVFVSPFLYIYDLILNIYKAYLIFPDEIFSPTYISKIGSATIQYDPLIQLKITFDSAAIHTNIEIVKIIESDVGLNYKLTIPLLGIYAVDLDTVYTYPSIIVTNLLIYVYAVDINGNNLYEFKFDNIGLITDFGDFLHLKKFGSQVIDVPLIHKENYLANKLFYLNRFKSQLGSLNLKETRLASDDIQLKFLNTFYLPANYTKELTVQEHDIDIKFPLVVNIALILNKTYVISNKLDIQLELNNLSLIISTYLDSLNSASFKFYKTVLIDMCQSLPWIKHVAITLKDSSTIPIDIPNYNIETLPQKDFMATLTRDELLNFTPTLFWIDINQLKITYQFIGD